MKRLGRYEIIQPIARGGMATVYYGRMTGMGGFERYVAIKVMHAHIADEEDFVTMFLDEARLAARIHHPNVVSTLDVQTSDEGLFLVMAYVEGTSLRHLLRELRRLGRRLPIGVTLKIMLDCLAGLHAAHELRGPNKAPLKLVHRDVSPHNVLVGTDGVARITDFGVARAEARLASTKAGALKGKLAYMAPEQALSGSLDRRADVYAAGVVFWEMLTGHRLFKADSEAALISKVLLGPAKSPRQHCPDVPEAIDTVCMKALTTKPDERYATAATFAEELELAAYACDVLVAPNREVAAFAATHKIDVNSVPPPPYSADQSGSFNSVVGSIDIASVPSFSSGELMPAGDVTQATRQVPAVEVARHLAAHRLPKRLLVGAASAATLVVAGVLWSMSGGDPSPSGAAATAAASVAANASASPTAASGTAVEPATGPGEIPTVATSATSSASAEPASTSAPDASAVAAPSASAEVSYGNKGPAVPWKRPSSNPADFEPDDL